MTRAHEGDTERPLTEDDYGVGFANDEMEAAYGEFVFGTVPVMEDPTATVPAPQETECGHTEHMAMGYQTPRFGRSGGPLSRDGFTPWEPCSLPAPATTEASE
ncbi:MAG: hypothetical protein JWM93_2453 [Frankiales bacterium]|nr:hypothetical protein [Frankiales bacterium]